MKKVYPWIRHELTEAMFAFIFFAISFNLVHLSESLMLQPDDIRYTSYLGATLGAILASKVMIIAKSLRVTYLFKQKSMLHNIIWKFIIFSILALIAQMLDFYGREIYYQRGWFTAYQNLVAELMLPLFWGVQVMVLYLILIYIGFGEIIRAIGRKEFKKMLIQS